MAELSLPVLVVDDNPDFLRVMRTILEQGVPTFAVHTVATATEALAFLGRQPPFVDVPRPAFVVLDFRLPDMNAPAVLTWLAGRDDLRRIPVLVLSQAGWAEDEAAARAAGACAFRVKPSRLRGLREAVVTFWREHVDGGVDPADRG